MYVYFSLPERTQFVISRGTTNQKGYCSLTADVTVPAYYGSPKGQRAEVGISGECLNIFSSSGTLVYDTWWLYPQFNTMIDCDGNDILDDNKMPLVEKFCPTYILNSATDYVRPEPVEYMGVEKSDLWFDLYNASGQFVDTYRITQQSSFDPAIHEWHGWVTGPGEFSFFSL